MKRVNFLSGSSLDRAAELRGDPGRVDEAWRSPGARVLPVWRSQHFVVDADGVAALALLEARAVDALGHVDDRRVLLGLDSGVAYFAADVSDIEAPGEALGLDASHRLVSLREAAGTMSQEEGALLAYANGILSWHRRHRYCGRCGSETALGQAGHVRLCSNESCSETHFPRTDPAIIVLVTDDEGRALLGRQAAWPKGVYSTLAGFVEPGESLEEAVAREVREETGVEVDDVRYHSSQPWPFPSSIMLGFVARATTRELRPLLDELEDARWFAREDVRARRGVELPSRISIARRLVEDWLADG